MQIKQNIKTNKEAGFTLIEIMVSAALLGFIAAALLPSFSELVNRSKINSYRLACASIVKAKMQEYIGGTGAMAASTVGQVPTGFQYAKYRYQTVTNSCRASPPAATPGFRESMLGNTVLSDTAATEDPSASGQKIFRERLEGFQLWVNLRAYNPRSVGGPTRACPSPTGASQYQFLRSGDGIEITVTGMIRTDPLKTAGGRRNTAAPSVPVPFGGLSDLNATTPNPKLTCSLTQLIYPQKQLYRYYLTSDGRIVNTQLNERFVAGVTSGGNVAESSVSHFRQVWSQTPTGGTVSSPAIPNIKSIAISPENDRVYVLKPSEIWQYTGCTDTSVTIGGNVFQGVPDCTRAPTSKVYIQPFTISDIAVDFSDGGAGNLDNIYGVVGTTGNLTLMKYVVPSPLVNGSTATFLTNSDYTISSNFRIKSIFLVPILPNTSPRIPPTLYFADNDCYQGPAAAGDTKTPFCTTIHNASDASFNQPLGDALVQAIDFSH